MKLFVTGGAGFIGSAFVRMALAELPSCEVVNFDALTYAGNLDNLEGLDERRHRFVRGVRRFLQVSTDEVMGSLPESDDAFFTEESPFAPNSPYSASKAAAEHLVRAAHHTFGLDTVITRCGNNYGPRQFPEKFLPLMIASALNDEPIPVYGDGRNVRDWI